MPWKVLTRAGHTVHFATELGGSPPHADPLLLSGVIMGQLGAEPEPKAFYQEMLADPLFDAPVSWSDVQPSQFDGLLLAGGHAPGMRQYLSSDELRHTVANFWSLNRPVAAICHGVLVLARTHDNETGRSLLFGRRTTCLPKYMERTAYFATSWRLGRYYRTYPAYVEDEVRAALACREDFVRGPLVLSKRGSDVDDRPAMFVRDANYLSARWPGDAYLFAKGFVKLLEERAASGAA